MDNTNNKPKFERGNSIQNLRRTLSQLSSKSVEDTDAIPEFKVRRLRQYITLTELDSRKVYILMY